MKNVLIDNCSLRHLIDNHGFSKYIQELEDMLALRQIELYTHELVLVEWNRHKEKWKHDKERKIKYIAQNSNTPENNHKGIVTINNQILNIHLDEQIKKLDIILSKATIIQTPEGITNEVAYRITNALYPFKNKKDSVNDWKIFGSFANHCENYEIEQLVFISHNHNEFADESNIEKQIHSSLRERFNKVQIIYYKNISDFFEEFNSNNFLPTHLLKYQIVKSSKYSFPATMKSNVLDALYNLYSNLYREINFIPIHILSKCFPFSTSGKSYVYFSGFRLSYVNDVLIDFMDNIMIDENKSISFKDLTLVNFIKEYELKMEFVLRHLTQNLIFHLSGENSRKIVCTHYHINLKCNCYRCSLDKFDFVKSFQEIQTVSIGNKERLKQAYIHYQIGNYISANKLYTEIVSTSLEQKEYLLYFLAKYNQRHLANFLSNMMINKDVDYKLIDVLKEIDPLEEAVKLKGYADYNFMTFIAQEDFFNNAFQSIKETVENIVDHYYLQLNGGWSTNQHASELIEEYAKLDTLLNNNYIVYDKYSNYSKLFEMVIEGLFASHAISETQENRIQSFDNYWLNKFIYYGNKKAFIKFFKKYKLKSLKYSDEDLNNEPFINLANNILTNSDEMKETIDKLSDKNIDFFKFAFNKYFENLLTVTSLLDLNKEMVNEIAVKLLLFLKVEKVLYHNEFDCVRSFLELKKDIIERPILLEYFEFFLFNNQGHDESSLETIIECFEDNSFIEITEEQFDLILNQSITICEKCKQTHSIDILISLYFKVSDFFKAKIENRINETLNNEFKFNLFFTASIYGIIKPDTKKIYTLIDNYIIPQEKKTYKGFFSRNIDFLVNYLDELFNLCFKFDIDTTDIRFDKFRNIHPYYNWLLDMDNFDYMNFNIEWVSIHQVTYFFKRMSKSKRLITHLADYLNDNSNHSVERILIQITYYV